MSFAGVLNDECLTSYASIAIALAFAQSCRYLIRQRWENEEDNIRIGLNDLLAAFEKVVVVLELPIILHNAGYFWHYTTHFLTGVWFIWQWDKNRSCSCIPGYIENLSKGKTTLVNVLARFSFELSWAILIYPYYLQPLWSLFPNQPIRGRKASGIWVSNIKANDITMSVAFWIEFGLSFVFEMFSQVSNVAFGNGWWPSIGLQSMISAAVSSTQRSSGGIMNPVYGTVQQWGCEGITVGELLFIYWFGPFAGFLLGFIVFKWTESIGDDGSKEL